MTKTQFLKIGTCSWKYDSWRGILYSDNPKLNYLEEYSQKLETVEIDQWFWSLFGASKVALPKAKDVHAYHDAVPADFKFTVKIPNSISLTHFYRKEKTAPLVPNTHFLSVALFRQFLEAVAPLKNKIGMFMLQFEYLSREKMPTQQQFQNQLGAFFAAIPNTFRYAIEVRNPHYLNREFFSFLNQIGVSPVLTQGYYLPPLWEVYAAHADLFSDVIVLRLMGPDRQGIEQSTAGEWNKIVDPKDEELQQIMNVINDIKKRGGSAYLNINNHYEGSAPLTIGKIQALLRARQ